MDIEKIVRLQLPLNFTSRPLSLDEAGMHIAKRQHVFQKVLRDGIDLSTQDLNE